MQRHRERVNEIESASITGAEAQSRWSEAIRSVADQNECPQYGGLRIVPQFGLLPMARNPASGLWEFAYLPTGEAPPQEQAAAEPEMKEASAMILVLVPADSARAKDPEAAASRPFFLSKYEMARAQWRFLTDDMPSTSRVPRSVRRPGLLPVETVSAMDCEAVLERVRLELPTQVQWESAMHSGEPSHPPIAPRDDRRTQVNETPANWRGFFGMDCNVWEWCKVAAPPGGRGADGHGFVVCGGIPERPPQPRGTVARQLRHVTIGVRPMLPLVP
jgi:formylglycine-generating enzyme required for sulfatase activity